MGNRLSKIYTRTGDKGTTGLANGKRMSKSDAIFEVMGDVDELNSQMGMVQCLYQNASPHLKLPKDGGNKSQLTDATDLYHAITIIQHLLFNLGGEIAMLGSEYAYQGIEEKHIDWLESQIDEMNSQLQPLKEFILPAGSQLMCQLHLARSVCRRAERHAITLNNELKAKSSNTKNDNSKGEIEGELSETALQFLNRLSDWLFVASRFVGLSEDGSNEVLWDKNNLS